MYAVIRTGGKQYRVAPGDVLKIESIPSGDKTVELGSEALPNIAGQNILAGQKRRFMLPWPEGLPDGPFRVTFDFIRHF